jgi:hypothetical protein
MKAPIHHTSSSITWFEMELVVSGDYCRVRVRPHHAKDVGPNNPYREIAIGPNGRKELWNYDTHNKPALSEVIDGPASGWIGEPPNRYPGY